MRRHGVVYTLGVLCSFLVLAGVVIGVQQAGKLASWGMQFGNPTFVVAMTVLVTLVALNLFGVFEVFLGGGAMTAATQLASKEGNAGAFFNGVLATALATPCTAPFLGAALGFAFSQPPLVVALMFLVVVLVIFAFQAFAQADILTGGGPAGATETLVFKIFYSQEPINQGAGAVMAVGLFGITLIVTLAQFLLLDRRVHYGN